MVINVHINKKRIEESYNFQAENYRGSKQIAELLLRDMQIPSNPIGLDIGCGDGVTTFALYENCNKQGQIYGLDISQRMVEKASENKRKLGYNDINFIKGDAESLNFPDNMFDVVISLYTFQFFPDKLKALKEMYRVLRPGGRLGLYFPAGKEFQREIFEIFKKIEKRHLELCQLNHVMKEYGEMHIKLEEFQDLLGFVGFTGLDVLGRHRIYYVNPKNHLEQNPYPVDLLLTIPIEFREQIKNEVNNEMDGLSDHRGFKLTFYNIQAYAQRPSYL